MVFLFVLLLINSMTTIQLKNERLNLFLVYSLYYLIFHKKFYFLKIMFRNSFLCYNDDLTFCLDFNYFVILAKEKELRSTINKVSIHSTFHSKPTKIKKNLRVPLNNF